MLASVLLNVEHKNILIALNFLVPYGSRFFRQYILLFSYKGKNIRGWMTPMYDADNPLYKAEMPSLFMIYLILLPILKMPLLYF